ncbi:AAA family ATPase [Lacihabitans soyangensis]|uniref:AAA family ATPase n=1 Tax=Lacihabitans soyangensis TaxID=869394 RepID=A0AAE3H1L9_9BACT|nr:AAA family ATPase [Lacihabitans soyangensis]MCP9762987.1 AAA family ATPase [Lacihabitans soyangensis]
MKLEIVKREQAKIKIGLQGASGSGKSYSALLLAYGMLQDWSKIAVIDTENKSASLYSHLGRFYLIDFKPPYSPERYLQAVNLCIQAGIEVVIIDNISMEWEFILEAHSQLSGNSYTNWAKFTPRHQMFINAILQADIHIICTLRAKQDYVLTPNKDGKLVPEKVGMKAIQRDGVDYELTLVFELDQKHNAVATKDRTGLFEGMPDFKISQETGRTIVEWCKQGEITVRDYANLIKACDTLEELRNFYESVAMEVQTQFKDEFNLRQSQLKSFTQNYSQNGTTVN